MLLHLNAPKGRITRGQRQGNGLRIVRQCDRRNRWPDGGIDRRTLLDLADLANVAADCELQIVLCMRQSQERTSRHDSLWIVTEIGNSIAIGIIQIVNGEKPANNSRLHSCLRANHQTRNSRNSWLANQHREISYLLRKKMFLEFLERNWSRRHS